MEYGTLAYARKGGVVQRFALRPGNITIGSALDSDIVLAGDEVAASHARLVCATDGTFVVDLGSAGGTFLNLVRLQPNIRHPLRDGDIIRVGAYFIRFTFTGPTATATTGAVGMASSGPGATPVLPPEIAARIPARRTNGAGPLAQGGGLLRRLNGNAPPRTLSAIRALDEGLSSYVQYLPPPLQESEFMGRFLLIFEAILDPLERQIDNMHFYFDPRTTPEALLAWLTEWVGIISSAEWPLARRRSLVAAAATLYRWRGTRRGLAEALRIFAELEPSIVEPGDAEGASLPPHTFAVIIEAPDPAQIDRRLLESVVEIMKPAHTSYVLEIRALSN